MRAARRLMTNDVNAASTKISAPAPGLVEAEYYNVMNGPDEQPLAG